MIEDQLLKKIHADFNLELKPIKKVEIGTLSDNFILGNSSQRFFLKCYRAEYDCDRIAVIHRVKQQVAENGIPAVLPIKNQFEATFFSYHTRYYALFPYVTGKTFKRGRLPSTAIKSAGTLLAKIHLLDDTIDKTDIPQRGMSWDREQALILTTELLERSRSNNSRYDQLARPYLERKLNLIKTVFQKPQEFQLEEGFCHGDYHDQNMFFDQGNQIRWLFDWEKTWLSDQRYELLRSAFIMIFDGFFSNERYQLAETYFSAYRQLKPTVTEKLLEFLDFYRLLTIYRGDWIIKEHYLNGNTRPDIFINEQIRLFDALTADYEQVRHQFELILS